MSDRGVRMSVDLPEPACRMGYTHEQLETIFANLGPSGKWVEEQFQHWMRGQTRSICTGELYDHDKREYKAAPEPCASTPHGPVTYRTDVETFFAGLPPLD